MKIALAIGCSMASASAGLALSPLGGADHPTWTYALGGALFGAGFCVLLATCVFAIANRR